MLAVFSDPPPPGMSPTGLLQVAEEVPIARNSFLVESTAGQVSSRGRGPWGQIKSTQV